MSDEFCGKLEKRDGYFYARVVLEGNLLCRCLDHWVQKILATELLHAQYAAQMKEAGLSVEDGDWELNDDKVLRPFFDRTGYEAVWSTRYLMANLEKECEERELARA